MASGPLNDQLEAIPGVAAVEVTLVDGAAPHARIWLDGSGDPDEVARRVRSLLGSHLPARPVRERPTRRSGLGRGLGDLLVDDDPDAIVPHIHGGSTAPSSAESPIVNGEATTGTVTITSQRAEVQRVGIVEAIEGVHVEVEDDRGTRHTHRVGTDGSIDAAVVAAMRALLGLDQSLDIKISEASIEDGEIVVATTVDSEGVRSAGAAFIEFGRPWALAVALTQAIDARR